MIDIKLALYVLLAHFIADFVFQTDEQAKNKSKSNEALLSHITTYTVILACFMFKFNPLIALLNGAIHFVVDYFTSRATSKLWAQGKVHDFFVVIGFDQYIHAATLLLTYGLLS